FEKSKELAEQAIEVDPLRGVFLLHRSQHEIVPSKIDALPEAAGKQPLLAVEQPKETAPEREADRNPEQTLQNTFAPVEVNSPLTPSRPSSVVPFPDRTGKESQASLPPIAAAGLNRDLGAATEAKFVTVDLDAGFAPPSIQASEPAAFDDLSEFLQEL